MTIRTAVTRASRFGLLLAVLTFLLGTAPVRAASSIEIDARALVGGRYEVGGWLAVAVTLVNDGTPTAGDVTAETPAGTVRRHVEMPAGARKVVMLYVQPEAFQRTLSVRYEEPNGTVSAEVPVRVLEQSSGQRAIVGDGGGTLRPQLIGAGEITGPEPLLLAPSDLPERPEALRGLDAIVWAGDSASLTEAQRRTLERWVDEGGQLVVIGGPDWQARTAAFTDLLPVEALSAVDGVPQAALAAWAGSEEAATQEATVSTGTLRADARALITADDGTLLASMRPVGAGRVVLVGTDLASDAHRGWEGSPRLWGRMLPSGAIIDVWMGGGFPIREEIDTSYSGALETLPSLAVPPAELLLVVIVGYILLIGPISYLVLRRVDRRELAWVTAPLLVLVFSGCSYGIGRTLKGSDVIVNQITVIRSASAGTAASVETLAGIYSPDRATYDVSVEADALMGRLLSMNRSGFGTAPSPVRVEQGDPARLRDLAIGVFGFEGVRAIGVVEHDAGISVSWTSRGGRPVGTVTNLGETTLADVAWISAAGGEMIGDIEPGESVEFEVPSTNFNGSSASDQVYGFGGFNSGSDEQRRIQLRRQVIDALVGYGGLVSDGGKVGGSDARGPYLVGWRDGDGPLPVLVDGQESQRYATEVEVIAARPPLGVGAVTLGPHMMEIAVVEMEGDASSGGPGVVHLGTGSVTYSVALPLEASGLAADEVEILVGPDPHSLSSGGGGFGGFWPNGYTVEVRDPSSGSWLLLGDLGTRNRFEVDDPAAALSLSGRIEVRVTGEADPSFGQASIFISARVSGVIDQ
ncbi:MAG TPA: hypothetical protein VMP86_05580 [Candidatus Binatia bacterium]|nr:hypothetical protein [Candidatus Binatia bacterium]